MANRLNILIGRVVDGARGPDGEFNGVAVSVREGYTSLDQIDERPVYVQCPMSTVFDRDAVNNLGQQGAFRVVVDVPAVERAVVKLRGHWGDIPVQDNSGRFPHLATVQGVWR